MRFFFLNNIHQHAHVHTNFFCSVQIKAASSHAQISVRLWGPGWAMYNEKISARENILRAFPNIQFDIIYTKTRHYNVTSPTAVVVHGTADCHQHTCLNPEVYPSHADAITYRYAGLIMEFSRPNQWKSHESKRVKKMYPNLNETERRGLMQPMPFFFHSPDCADEELLHPVPSTQRQQQTWAESRPVSIRLIGNHRKELYPLRYKIWNAIKSGKIQNAVIYQHVGNTINANDNTKGKQKSETISVEGWNNASTGPGNSLGVIDPHDPDVAHHRKNQQDWARVLATTQICVFDSSIVRKAVRKFQESFMSGCVVASDIPLEMEDLFKDVVIPLNVKMSVDQINSILQEYLQDKDKLEWMAREAFKRARMHWTCRNKVDRLIQAAARVLEGERGYWFPFGYSATCRKFWTEAKYETEWCQINDSK
ncbi:hypothetical protein BDR26DRAFT_814962 [Obelidium mucronatum]|nr:hypothetical protein BDR26DRAFT_814962 [Obelidium mucronatum]